MSFKSQSWHCSPKVSPGFPIVYPLLSAQTILQSQDVTDLCSSNRSTPALSFQTMKHWGPRQHLIGYYVHKTAVSPRKVSVQIFVKLNRNWVCIMSNWRARDLNDYFSSKPTGLDYAKDAGNLCVWLVTFWFPRGSTRGITGPAFPWSSLPEESSAGRHLARPVGNSFYI